MKKLSEAIYRQMSNLTSPTSRLVFVGDDDTHIIDYNIAKQEWKELVSLREPTRFFKVAAIKKQIFIAGGIILGDSVSIPSTPHKSIHIFDHERNEIEYNKGELPIPLLSFQMLSVGDHLYVLGGKSHLDANPVSSVYKCLDDGRFDWVDLSPMEIPRCQFSSIIFGGFIYVFGGLSESGIVSKCSKYNISADSWMPIADMPRALSDTAATIYNDSIYLAGGVTDDGNEEVVDTYIYSPDADSWRSGPPMLTPKSMCSLVNVNDVLHVFGGCSGDDFLGSMYETLEESRWVESWDAYLDSFLDGAVGI